LTNERGVVVRYGISHGMVSRQSRLDKYPPGFLRAPRPSRHLAQKLKASFRRPKIREIDADIGVDHPDERHVRKIQALGDQLRAEQHVDLAASHAIEDLGVRPFPRRRVYVHPRDACAGETLGEESLDLLRAEPPASQRAPGTSRASLPRRLLVQTIMTD